PFRGGTVSTGRRLRGSISPCAALVGGRIIRSLERTTLLQGRQDRSVRLTGSLGFGRTRADTPKEELARGTFLTLQQWVTMRQSQSSHSEFCRSKPPCIVSRTVSPKANCVGSSA